MEWIVLLFIVTFFITLSWRFFSQKHSLPHPSWLGWMVSLDNPFLKEHGAQRIISHLELTSSMEVLDFGCGTGRLSIPIARIIDKGTLTTYDIQEKMLLQVQNKASKEGLNNIQTTLGSVEHLLLPPQKYDRIILVTVIGEVVDKQSLLKQLYNALKPQGVLSITEAISDPHYQSIKKVQQWCEEVGFTTKAHYGNRWNYTLLVSK